MEPIEFSLSLVTATIAKDIVVTYFDHLDPSNEPVAFLRCSVEAARALKVALGSVLKSMEEQ